MIIKSYSADTIDEAEKKVQSELGPDAIILTTRKLSSKNHPSGKSQVEITAAIEKKEYKGKKIPEKKPTPKQENPWENAVERLLMKFPNDPSSKRISPPAPPTSNESEIRSWIRDEIRKNQPQKEANWPSAQSFGASYLIKRGVHPKIANAIEKKLDETIGTVDWNTPNESRSKRIGALQGELSKRIRAYGPIPVLPLLPTCHAIVGASGSGKSSALTKLALYYQRVLKKKVQILSLSGMHIGEKEKWQALSEHHQLPYSELNSFNDLEEKIKEFQNSEVIFIDTPGISRYKTASLNQLVEWDLTKVPLHYHLCLRANTKTVDSLGAIRAFSRLPLESLILTKLDESLAPGFLLNLYQHPTPPISFATIGEELVIADSNKLAKLIMTQHSSEEYELIRGL